MLEKQIQNDTLKAMKDSDKFKLSVLRLLKSAIQNEKINKKDDLSDNELIMVIKKQVKTRKDSLTEYEKYNRDDLVANLKKEIEILSQYLPKELTLEEVNKNLDIIFQNYPNPTIKDMGKIMSDAKIKMGTQTDASILSKLVKERLTK